MLISFDLIKGAYATTLIYELFDIEDTDTKLATINTDFVDTKKICSTGTLENLYSWVMQDVSVECKKN